MTEQEIDVEAPRGLHRAAEQLVDHWAGAFFPARVERCADRARHGTEPGGLVPDPVSEAVLCAAERILPLGPHGAVLTARGAMVRGRPGSPLAGDHGPAAVADLEGGARALWVGICTPAVSVPSRRAPGF